MAIQHTVVFRLAHEQGSAAESEFLDTARAILTGIDGVTEFTINKQISDKCDLDWQFSMVFSDQAAYDAYNTHPAHLSFVETLWVPQVHLVPGVQLRRPGEPGAGVLTGGNNGGRR